jgi:hypothetical protein
MSKDELTECLRALWGWPSNLDAMEARFPTEVNAHMFVSSVLGLGTQ